jgi:hypothetical protein
MLLGSALRQAAFLFAVVLVLLLVWFAGFVLLVLDHLFARRTECKVGSGCDYRQSCPARLLASARS